MKSDTKKLLLIIVILVIDYGLAINAFHNRSVAQANLNNAKVTLQKANNNANKKIKPSILNQTTTLAPAGQTQVTDKDASQINKIINLTFAYTSPKQYYQQALQLRPLVSGSFYNWWFGKKSLKYNEKLMEYQASGRNYKRYYQNYSLTRQSKNKYYVYIQSGVLIGDAKRSDIRPNNFFLIFTKDKNTWNVKRIDNVYDDENN